MANIFDRLGKIFGRKENRPSDTPVAESPPESAATDASAVPTAPEMAPETASTPPLSETPLSGGSTSETVATETAPPPSMASEPDAVATAPALQPPPAPVAAPPPVAATVDAAPTAAAETTTAPEPTQQDRLWAETDSAWAQEDWERVVQSLTGLRVLQPERSAEIDEKLGAANYNWAAKVEQAGDTERALWLYEEAQRRNPNLGEASFAIERLQAQLQPAPAGEPVAEATPAEQTYTVQEGDNLSAIAERFYGSQAEWTRIYEANRDQIDNPDLIHPGQTLKIPS